MATYPMSRVSEALYEIPVGTREGQDVPVRFVADEGLMARETEDKSLEQLTNVATLPGVVGPVIGMPDMHEGYGFPVGGVAATRPPDGVISPGGIGFDINCGVRLLASNITREQLGDRLETLTHELSRSVPTGYGRHGRLDLSPEDMEAVLAGGAQWVVHERGLGLPEDLDNAESNGRLPQADPSQVSERARQRGHDQLGTLGGGNHFLEIQEVEQIADEELAAALGLSLGQVTILIHTGSRGLGHQVCTDYVRLMDQVMARYGIHVPDRQLACAPLSSPEGQAYFAAMSAAANFAWANRQVLTHRVREVFRRVVGSDADPSLRVVYDVAHNIAKLERHGGELLCVHRKGATRAFGPHAPGADELPPRYRQTGQPVFIPGSMGTGSWVLVGDDRSEALALGSCCHGAGRALSRSAAKKQVAGHVLRKELEARGIVVRCPSNAELAEEAPLAYKDVDHVVDVVARAGLARKVARLRPLGVLKG